MSRRPFLVRELSSLVGDVVSGGLVVHGYLDAEQDELPAFRTLVQLDGDICVQISRAALADRRFAAAFAAHRDEVERVLRARAGRLSSWLDRLGAVVGVVVGLGAIAAALPRDWQFDSWVDVALVSAAPIVGAGVWKWTTSRLIPALLRSVIRRQLEARTPKLIGQLLQRDARVVRAAQTRRRLRRRLRQT